MENEIIRKHVEELVLQTEQFAINVTPRTDSYRIVANKTKDDDVLYDNKSGKYFKVHYEIDGKPAQKPRVEDFKKNAAGEVDKNGIFHEKEYSAAFMEYLEKRQTVYDAQEITHYILGVQDYKTKVNRTTLKWDVRCIMIDDEAYSMDGKTAHIIRRPSNMKIEPLTVYATCVLNDGEINIRLGFYDAISLADFNNAVSWAVIKRKPGKCY